ncbi:MAG TPA: hypothetical protein VK835_11260 [Bacteroidia bacterium]|nr:hypothetical protein [Bacteroidia bacterium]
MANLKHLNASSLIAYSKTGRGTTLMLVLVFLFDFHILSKVCVSTSSNATNKKQLQHV